MRAGLGFEQCSAGWIEVLDEFLLATGVDGGSHGLLPSVPYGGAVVVGVLWWCWRSTIREGKPIEWFPCIHLSLLKLLMRWRLGGLVLLGAHLVGGAWQPLWELVADDQSSIIHHPLELSCACRPAGGPFRAQAERNDIYATYYVQHG